MWYVIGQITCIWIIIANYLKYQELHELASRANIADQALMVVYLYSVFFIMLTIGLIIDIRNKEKND